jgi:RNA polymerase sigma-70 factor (ECF subfamily)
MEHRPSSPFVERTLVHRLVAGDETALAELYDGHSGFVFGLALRVLGDRTAAEDVTQEVFVSFWERPDRFDEARGSLRAFLGTLTHRRAVDQIRREEARKRRETKTTSVDATPVPSVDDAALSTVTSEQVRAAVNVLPPAQREALELAYFHGHTYRQVADVLGIPEGTAKSRLRLALQRIADTLEPEVADRWA